MHIFYESLFPRFFDFLYETFQFICETCNMHLHDKQKIENYLFSHFTFLLWWLMLYVKNLIYATLLFVLAGSIYIVLGCPEYCWHCLQVSPYACNFGDYSLHFFFESWWAYLMHHSFNVLIGFLQNSKLFLTFIC